MGDHKARVARDKMRREIFIEQVPGYRRLEGLEIGALCTPLFTKDEAAVKYYDIRPKDELVAEFARYYPGRTFVDVDFVAGTRSLEEVLEGQKFDYIIANHVIEHVPDFIGFFKAAHRLLNDGGKVFLAIPDRRFTFDLKRSETTAGHLIVDHENGGAVDAAEHILDSLIYHEEKPFVYWSDIARRRYDFIHHHHVFNYENFIEKIIEPLIRLRYFEFSVVFCRYKPELGNEFVVVLEKCTEPDRIHVLGKGIERQPLKEDVATDAYDPRRQMAEISCSGWFDPIWYLMTYPSVRMSGLDPLEHYYNWGGFHGFNPCDRFDSAFYLEKNPDVRRAGYNPLWHYLHNGMKEGRSPMAST